LSGRPHEIDLVYSQHYCSTCRKYFSVDTSDLAPPGGRYELEVSSPGVERPLKQPLDFAKRVGEKVKVKTVEPVEGARTFVGTISEASPTEVTIVTEEGERRIAFDNVSSARTVFEWARGGSR